MLFASCDFCGGGYTNGEIKSAYAAEEENLEITEKIYWHIDDAGTLIFSDSEIVDGCDYFPGTKIYGNEGATPWDSNTKVTSAKVIGKVVPSSIQWWFIRLPNLKTIDLSGLYTAKVTLARSVFHTVPSLTHINFGDHFVTSNIKDMNAMFMVGTKTALESLDLSSFDMSGVEAQYQATGVCNFEGLLQNLSAINSLKLSQSMVDFIQAHKDSSYKINSITFSSSLCKDGDINQTFASIYDITEAGEYTRPKIYWDIDSKGKLTISDTTAKENPNYFYNTQKFDTLNNIYAPWYSQRANITSVVVTGLVKPLYLDYWFHAASTMQQADFSGLYTENVISAKYMLNACSGLKSLNFGEHFVTSKMVNVARLMAGVTSLEEIDLSNFDFSNVNTTDVGYYQYFLTGGLENLKSLKISQSVADFFVSVGDAMTNDGSLKIALYNKDLNKTVTKFSEMTAAGHYYAGLVIDFYNDSTKVSSCQVPYGSGEADIVFPDASVLTKPSTSSRLYTSVAKWTDASGNDVDLSKITSTLKLYAEFNYIEISAPTSSLEYNKSSHESTITSTDGASVNYVKYYYCTTSSGTFEEVANTINVGFYYAKVEYNGSSIQTAVYHITPKSITINGVSVNDKMFDNTTNATLGNITSDKINGLLAGDSVNITANATFDSKNVGVGKTVTINSWSLDTANYVIDSANSQKTATANITPKSITSVSHSNVADLPYTGSAQTPSVTLTDETLNYTLVKNTDYTISYQNNTDVGVASILIEGKGNYAGETLTINFNITPVKITGMSLTATSAAFNGTPQQPSILRVTDENGEVVNASNYTIIYKRDGEVTDDFTSAGVIVVTLQSDSYQIAENLSATFTITSVSLGSFQLNSTSATYNADEHKPVIKQVLSSNSVVLTSNDYSVSYLRNGETTTDFTSFGTITVVVAPSGKNTIGESLTKTFTINKQSVQNLTYKFYIVDGDDNTEVTAAELREGGLLTNQGLLVEVYLGSVQLIEDRDYNIVFKANENEITTFDTAGEVQMIVTGNGNYDKTYTLTFEVKQNVFILTEDDVSNVKNAEYTGAAHTIRVVVTSGNNELIKDIDYTLTFKRNGVASTDFTSAGVIEYVVIGKGAYSGVVSKTFEIAAFDISKLSINTITKTFNAQNQTISSQDIGLMFKSTTLVLGTDYVIEYTDNERMNAATYNFTLTGKGNFGGTLEGAFAIEAKNIGEIVSNKTIYKDFTGENVSITADDLGEIKLGDYELIFGTDYEINFADSSRVDVGDYAFTIIGKGNFNGSTNGTLKITKDNLQSITDATISGANDVVYNGSEQKPTLIVSIGGTTLVEDEDYSINYPTDLTNVGEKTITIVGIKYKDQKTIKFNITPATLNIVTSEIGSIIYGEEFNPTASVTFDSILVDVTITYIYSFNNIDFVTDIPKNVGTYYVKAVVAANGNFALSESEAITFTITAKEITINGIGIKDKIYNGKLDAEIDLSSLVINGLAEGDDMSITAVLTFDSAAVGTDKLVTISNITLTGEAAGNYVLASSGNQETATGNITPKQLDVNVTANGWTQDEKQDADEVITITGVVEGETIEDVYTKTYYKVVEGEEDELLLEQPATYGVYKLVISVCNSNYNFETIEKQFLITKKTADENGNGSIDIPSEKDVDFLITKVPTNAIYDLDGLSIGYKAQLWEKNGDQPSNIEFTDKLLCNLTFKLPQAILDEVVKGSVNFTFIKEKLNLYYKDAEGALVAIENYNVGISQDNEIVVMFTYDYNFAAEIVFNVKVEKQAQTAPAKGNNTTAIVLIVVGSVVAVALIGWAGINFKKKKKVEKKNG